MNRAGDVWAAGASVGSESAEPLEGAEIVQAVLSWRDARGGNVLGVKDVAAGATLSIGEQGDLLVPGDMIGAERVEVLRFDGERAVASLPAGGTLRVDGWARDEREIEVARGHVVELHVASFVVRLTRTRAGTKPAGAPLEGLRRGGAAVLLGSALAHTAAFAVLAYVSPALGATEEDACDRDRIELLQRMIDASAAREQERLPAEATDSAAGGSGGESRPAAGAEGAAGKDTPSRDGKWALRGTARPEDVTLPRERVLAAAADFGAIGLLATLAGNPDAPTVPWGRQQNGADDVDKIGHLYGGSLDDAMGQGGWALLGPGDGGGGAAHTIGLGNGLGPLGGTGTCTGGGPCDGIGHGRDRLTGQHVSTFKGPRYGVPQTSGHLPADVIQRIVRQNDGRYRFCFQQGLKANPALEGRVTVKFMIARDGSVGYASDGGSDIPDASVRQCVVSAFTALSFPAPDSGIVTVYYPIAFTPQ